MPATLSGPNSIVTNSSFTLTFSGYTIPVGATVNLYLTGSAQVVKTGVAVDEPTSFIGPPTAKSLVYFVALSTTPTVKIASKTVVVTLPPPPALNSSLASVARGASFNLTFTNYSKPNGVTLRLYLTGVLQPIVSDVTVDAANSVTAPQVGTSAIYYVATSAAPTVKLASKTVTLVAPPPPTLSGPNSAPKESMLELVIANYTIPQGKTLKIFLTGVATPVVATAIVGTNSFLAPSTGTSAVYYIALNDALTVKLASKTVTLTAPLPATLTGPSTAEQNSVIQLTIANYTKPANANLGIYLTGVGVILPEAIVGSNSLRVPNSITTAIYYIALSTAPTIKLASKTIQVTALTPILSGLTTAYKNRKLTLSYGNYFVPQGETLCLYSVNPELLESGFTTKEVVVPNLVCGAQYYIALASAPLTKIATLNVNVTEQPAPSLSGPSSTARGEPFYINVLNYDNIPEGNVLGLYRRTENGPSLITEISETGDIVVVADKSADYVTYFIALTEDPTIEISSKTITLVAPTPPYEITQSVVDINSQVYPTNGLSYTFPETNKVLIRFQNGTPGFSMIMGQYLFYSTEIFNSDFSSAKLNDEVIYTGPTGPPGYVYMYRAVSEEVITKNSDVLLLTFNKKITSLRFNLG